MEAHVASLYRALRGSSWSYGPGRRCWELRGAVFRRRSVGQRMGWRRSAGGAVGGPLTSVGLWRGAARAVASVAV